MLSVLRPVKTEPLDLRPLLERERLRRLPIPLELDPGALGVTRSGSVVSFDMGSLCLVEGS